MLPPDHFRAARQHFARPVLELAPHLRCGEVIGGLEVARRRRETPPGPDPRPRLRPLADVALARGPGNLARALGAERATTDGADLCGAGSGWSLYFPTTPSTAPIRTGPRVGVAGEGGDGQRFPWRFHLVGEPSVSAYRPA